MGNCCTGQPSRIGPPKANERSSRATSAEFNGPLRNRSCTDVFFLLLFIVFLGGMGYGIFHAAIRGNILRVLFGYTSYGDICGQNNAPLLNINKSGQNFIHEPYLVYEDLWINLANVNIQFDTSPLFWDAIFKNRTCIKQCPQGLQPFLQRCLPVNLTIETINTVANKTGLIEFFQEVSMDVQLCWKEIVYLCLIALGLAIVLTVLFRFFAGVVIWTVLLFVVCGCIAGSVYLWLTWNSMKEALSLAPNSRDESETKNMMIYAIVVTVITVIVILIVIAMRKRIQLVIALFREAGKVVHAMPLLLLQPVWTLLALCSAASAWFAISLLTESAGDAVADAEGYVFFRKDTFLQIFRWYNVFALIWISQFCIACQHLVIAGAVATWFFSRDKSRLGCPILTSLGRLMRYHLGSVAFGSLIVALVKMIRLIMNYIERRLKNNNLDNTITNCFFRCCNCCLACFERFIKYLNTNAYIEIAIYGENFCSSALRAFRILMSNALRVAAINSVGDFILFLGKLGVTAAVVFIGIEFMKNIKGVHHIWVPIAIAAIFAYFITHCFISVYEMCIDAIFICFCEDCKMNDGITRPYFMSKNLMEFVKNSRKALDLMKGRKRGRTVQVEGQDNFALNIGDERMGVRATAPAAS